MTSSGIGHRQGLPWISSPGRHIQGIGDVSTDYQTPMGNRYCVPRLDMCRGDTIGWRPYPPRPAANPPITGYLPISVYVRLAALRPRGILAMMPAGMTLAKVLPEWVGGDPAGVSWLQLVAPPRRQVVTRRPETLGSPGSSLSVELPGEAKRRGSTG